MIKKKKTDIKYSKITEDTADKYGSYKNPPNALELEQQVLGSILIDNQVFSDIVQMIRPEYFYRPSNSIVFSAMINLDNKSEPIDLHTVKEELKRMGKYDEVGGVEYLSEIVELVTSSAFARHHARIIYEKHILRDLIHISSEILEKCYSSDVDPFRILSEASKDILDTSESVSKKRVTPIEEDIVKVFEELGARRELGKDSYPGIPTGFTMLDDLTLGFQRSELIIIAARPSHGKTAFTLNIAKNAAMKGYKIAYFSLEMTKKEIITRLLSAESRVEGKRLKGGFTTNEEWVRVQEALPKLHLKIFIDDTSELNTLELRAKARRLKHDHEIDMVMVDYLQLLRGEGSFERRDLEVAHVSRSLKALAKELNIPVVAAAQLNRRIEQTKGEKNPQLSDLRESGSIEQDADVVMFIHREYLTKRHQEGEGEDVESKRKAEIMLVKQRNGPPGDFELTFVQEYTRFDNKVREPKLSPEQPYGAESAPF